MMKKITSSIYLLPEITRRLDFYSDGSWSSKSDMGGWASICVENGLIIDIQEGYEAYTTNNRMELKGFISVLETLSHVASSEHTEVHIHVDSTYLLGTFEQGWYKNWMKNGWRTSDGSEVKNQDLMAPAIAQYIKAKARFGLLKIEKVKAHVKGKNLPAENEYNKYVDKLANKQREFLESVGDDE